MFVSTSVMLHYAYAYAGLYDLAKAYFKLFLAMNAQM